MQTKHYSSRGQKPRFKNGARFNRKRSGGPRKQFIHPSKFINHSVRQKEPEVYEPAHTFFDFGFSELLEKNLSTLGFSIPSAIQDKSIPLIANGKDIIGLANTGTGKTAAFLLPTLEKLRQNPAKMSVLVIAPTRELAQQIDAECRRFSRGLRIYSTLCVGGVNIRPQIQQLQREPHIIIGTPGRLVDLMNQNQLHLDGVTTLILDEADRMLDMGFLPDVTTLTEQTARKRQTLLFSATMTSGVERIVNNFMNNPETVSVKTSETNEHIFQDVVEFDDDAHRKTLLANLLTEEEFEKVVVFGETKFGVQRLADLLSKQNIPATAIHGNKSQSQRERALKDFKNGRAKVLVATDVAARGLDIPNVSHVINFDTPQSYDDYIHRIGRTGRGGKHGTALTFIQKSKNFTR